jgi:hypothetical protein
MGGPQSVGGGSVNAGGNPAEAARRAEEARQRAEAARQAAEAARKAAENASSQKKLDGTRPKANELASTFEGSTRKAELEKRLGTPGSAPSQGAQAAEQPPASLDTVDAQDVQAARGVPDGQTFTDPSSGTKYQVRQNATTGETVLSDAASGTTVTVKPDGSYTATATVKAPAESGGTRATTWTKSSDAKGNPTGLKSEQRQTARHPETGTTTTITATEYNLSKSPPVPQSRTEQVQMERPPPAMAKRGGFPQGPVTVKTETRFNAEGVPAKQVKTTEARTPGFNAKDVKAFEDGSNGAFQNAAKGADHHHANNAPTNLKAGESSLTVTEETLFNARGEPAVSKQKTDAVAVKPMPGDTNGNGVQVVRSQKQVNRGPGDAASGDGLPALKAGASATVNNTTTVTGYDPDGSHFDKGHARRTQSVSRSSGTVEANGAQQLKHEPVEVKSLQEGSEDRWTYDHVSLQVGADGKPVAGQKPKELDRERQLPWDEDVRDFAADKLQDLTDWAGSVASEALDFAKDVVLEPLDAAIDQVTQPLEEKLTDEVKKLNSAGDTLTLSGGLDVKVGLKAGIEGEAEIERTADGKYTLSAEVTADFGVGVVGSASLNAGGRMEFTFDTPEEAARAAVIMGKGPASLASGGEDPKFMLDHLAAVEVNVGGELEAGLGAKLGPGGAELSASIGATTGYRVEFEKGKPTHLVRTTEVEGSGAASLASGLKGKAGLNVGGEVTGSVSLETKIPLDASKLDGKDVLAFMASPASAPFAGPAETTISVEGSVDTGSEGHFFTAEVAGLSGEEVQSISKKLMAGQFETAFDDVQVDAKMTTGRFKDREAGIDLKLGVVDLNVNARHRDVTAEGGNGNGGSTVSLGRGNRGGSNGTSGSDGSAGTGKPAGGSTPVDSGKPAGEASTPGAQATSKQPGETTTAKPPPPTTYRVNPATGKLVPVPPTEAKAPPESHAPGRTASGRKPVPVVTNPELPGRTTHVRYDQGGVRIEAGPQATPEDIQAHLETARILQRYEGAVGKVRQLIDKVKQALTGMPGYGSQGFESRLEVQKLNNILKGLEATQQQLDTRAAGVAKGGSPSTQAERERLGMELAQVGAQLRIHEAQVDSLARGRGYVAREDSPPLSPEDRKKALDLLHKAEGPDRWKNLLSQYEGKEHEATRNLLHKYRATIVAEAINEAVKQQEGVEPSPKCTPEALMSKEGWTSPQGAHFKASGSTNATSDLDVSITGPDSVDVAPLMMDFNQRLHEETGVDPNTLLDANILDKTEVPKGDAWKAISMDLNASERRFVQAAALMSDEHRDTLKRLAAEQGVVLDPEAQALADKAKTMLEEGVERLKTQRPDLTDEEVRKEAGNNIYQGFLQSVDTLSAERDALLKQLRAEGKHHDPVTGEHDLDPAQAAKLDALNVSLHENHMWARLFATEDYTAPSTIVDIVDNRQGGAQRELSPGQYRVSAQENAWFAGVHLGDASPKAAVNTSKYIDRTLEALAKSQPGPEAKKVLERILADDAHGVKRLLAFRSDPELRKLAQTPEGKKAVAQATREMEAQLKDVLTALGVKNPPAKPAEMMLALWMYTARA